MADAELKVLEVSTDDIQTGLSNGSLVVVDVREADEFTSGHIPGSVSMPLSSFDPVALTSFAPKRVVLSCRSGSRTLYAMKLAQDAGVDIREHYKASFNGWAAAGNEIARGT